MILPRSRDRAALAKALEKERDRSQSDNRSSNFARRASAITLTASSTTAIRINGIAAFFIAHLISRLSITRIEIKESVIYRGA